MDGDWARLARLVRERRQRLGLTQLALCGKTGVSRSTLQRVERGETLTRIPISVDRIAIGLGWAPGSIDAILEGRDATPSGDELAEAGNVSRLETRAADAFGASLADRLPPSVAVALESGAVGEHMVVDMPAGWQFVGAAVRGFGERTTPEQRRAEAAEWEIVRARIEEPIGQDEDGGIEPGR